MTFEDYQLSSKHWPYRKITNIDYFFELFNSEITPENIGENLNVLYEYRINIRSDSQILNFSDCSLEFSGVDEAVAIINGLERLKQKGND